MEIVLASLVLYNTMYIGSTLVQQKVYFSNDVDCLL
jgi:TnpA family transposase